MTSFTAPARTTGSARLPSGQRGPEFHFQAFQTLQGFRIMSSACLARPAYAETPHDLEATFTEKEFAYFAALVYETSGIVIGKHKKNMMFSRLVRRVRELKLHSFQEYCALVQGPEGGAEIGAFINAMTTQPHEVLSRGTSLPVSGRHGGAPSQGRGRRERQQKRIRIWSAGCSSGEEPYSIAIALRRALPEIRQWDARILATDLDTSMVSRGAKGVYPLEAVSELSPERAQRLLRAGFGGSPEGAGDPDLRSLITFKPLNCCIPGRCPDLSMPSSAAT